MMTLQPGDRLTSYGTVLEVTNAGDGVVRVRYLLPIQTEEINESYPVSALELAGWRRVETTRAG